MVVVIKKLCVAVERFMVMVGDGESWWVMVSHGESW